MSLTATTEIIPASRCDACGLTDDHPKHMVLVAIAQTPQGNLYHPEDTDHDGVLNFHFDCETVWNDLRSALGVHEDPASHAHRMAVADFHEEIVRQAKSGVHGDELRQFIQKYGTPISGGAGGIDQTRANEVLAAWTPNSGTKTVGSQTITGPISLRLMTANGSDTAAGTELSTGSGYTAGGSSLSFAASSAGAVSTNAAVSWTNMPSCTLTGCEEWDASATKLRTFWGPWTGGNITVAAGNTFTVSSGSLTNSLA